MTANKEQRAAGGPKARRPSAGRLGFTPCLWFNHEAEAAAQFYVTVFPHSRITKVQRAAADYPNGKAGDVLLVDFKLDGKRFNALNGGPFFQISEAISFIIDCKDQAELDHYYEALSAVPEAEQCGWVKDQFGVSWQLIPAALGRLLGSRDPAKAQRVMEAMLVMKRLDVAALEAAGRGESSGPANRRSTRPQP